MPASHTETSPAGRAAAAVVAPLTPQSRLLLRHDPTMTVPVPASLDRTVACVAGRWAVAASTAAAWLLADGLNSLLAAYNDFEILPQSLEPARSSPPNMVPLQIHTPGPLCGATLKSFSQMIDLPWEELARVALAKGAVSLHDDHGAHTCAVAAPHRGGSPHTTPAAAANKAGVTLPRGALDLLAKTVAVSVELPAQVDDVVGCLARRWGVTADIAATWLLADGAVLTYYGEASGDTSWRQGPTRAIPTHRGQPATRRAEMPSEPFVGLVHQLAGLLGGGPSDVATIAVTRAAATWLLNAGCACGPQHSPAPERGPTAQSPGL